jgi:hypothetical protein
MISQHQYNKTLDEINKAFEQINARLDALEKPKVTPKKPAIDKTK